MTDNKLVAQLHEILDGAPTDPFRGEKTAFYSVGCTWWTSDANDLGQHPSGLPCCPHCRSMLMEAPLEDFLLAAQEQPEHYGPDGLDNFIASHHGHGPHRREWTEARIKDE